MEEGTSAVSSTSILALDALDQTNSLYVQNLQKEVKVILTLHGIGFPQKCDHIIPSVCHPFDVDIAQSICYETNSSSMGRDETLSMITDIDSFHDIAWSCSQSEKKSGSINISDMKQRVISFADSHFQSAATVAAMSQLELGCLALWLSWYPFFFGEKDSNLSDVAFEQNDVHDEWHWNQYKDNVVTGLLNVLGSQKHDPKCLSIAVSCLSFLVEQHSSSDSVLTDANISQLLRLGLSKAVYPTIDPTKSKGPCPPVVLAPPWEITFCRIGVRRLLQISQVLDSESAVNETFTFVSKWWERLKGATKGSGSGFETPGKLMKNSGGKEENSVPLIPVVRCALDVISDLYELVPQIKSYVRHMIVGDSLLFLTSYLSSSDPKTVISAAKFLSNIILDFVHENVTKFEGSTESDAETVLPLGDLHGVYDCCLNMLENYCRMRDIATATTTATTITVGSAVLPGDVNTVSSELQKQQQRISQSQSRTALSDCTNIIHERDGTTLTRLEKANKESMDSKACMQPPTLSSTAARIVLAPLIGSLSVLITICLQAADTLPGYSQYFFPPLGPSTHSSKHTARPLGQVIRILFSSLKVACNDVIVLNESPICNTEVRREGTSKDIHKGFPLRYGRTPSSCNQPRGGEGAISKNLFERRNQTVFNIFSALSILYSNSATSITRQETRKSQGISTDSFSLLITEFMESLEVQSPRTGSGPRSSPIEDALFSAVHWGVDSLSVSNSKTEKESLCGVTMSEKSRLNLAKLLKAFQQQAALHKKIKFKEREEPNTIVGQRTTRSRQSALQEQEQVERKDMNQGASLCSAASVDDSQSSLLPTLTPLGHGSDNDNSLHLSDNGSVDTMSPLITGTGKYVRASYSPIRKREEGRVSLSKIFTPAHSKSREEMNTESDSSAHQVDSKVKGGSVGVGIRGDEDVIVLRNCDPSNAKINSVLFKEIVPFTEKNLADDHNANKNDNTNDSNDNSESKNGKENGNDNNNDDYNYNDSNDIEVGNNDGNNEDNNDGNNEGNNDGNNEGNNEDNNDGNNDGNNEDNNDGNNDGNNEDNDITTDMCMSVDEEVGAYPSACQSNYISSSGHRSQISEDKLDLGKFPVLSKADERIAGDGDIEIETEGVVEIEIDVEGVTSPRVDLTTLAAQLAAVKSELQSVRTENCRLIKARDTLFIDRENVRNQCTMHAADAAGLKSAVDHLTLDNQTLNGDMQSLQCEVQGLRVSLIESQQRKGEQEQLIQEAWLRLSVLAKKEAGTHSLNEQLSAQILHANSKASESSSLLAILKARVGETDIILESLRLQLIESQLSVQQHALETLTIADKLTEKKSEYKALTAQFNIIEIQYQAVSTSLNNCQEKLKLTDIDLGLSNSNLSAMTLEFERERICCEDLRDQLENAVDRLAASEDIVEEMEATVKEWEEKFINAECTYREEREIQQMREKELREELEENISRGDNAENDLLKHKELISFINKLSAEGEAGRAKARRLSAAVIGNGKRTSEEGVGNGKIRDEGKNEEGGGEGEVGGGRKGGERKGGGVGDGIESDTAGDISISGERCRKVKRPSNK